jgi:hypothetical protein
MDEVEEALVEVIVRLGAARRLRERQLREMRLLQESGNDTSATETKLAESKRIIREVQQERKELAAKLLKKRSLGFEPRIVPLPAFRRVLRVKS